MLSIETRPRSLAASAALGPRLDRVRKELPVEGSAAAEPELAGLPCLQKKSKSMGFDVWVSDVLGRCRGVMTALPRSVWPKSSTESQSAVARIVALDPQRACGLAWWWLVQLHGSEYVSKMSYTLDDHTAVYHTDGLEAAANTWLPTNADYDALVLSSGFDSITLAGFCVTVRRVTPLPDGRPTSLDQVPALHQRLLLELEASAMEWGPAILATMLVHTDDLPSAAELRLPSNGEIPTLRAKVAELGSARIAACVSVTQTHSFRLSDLLSGYNKVLGDPLLQPSLTAVNGSVYEVTMAIARKVRSLATTRIVKLNMTPATIVFCPKLHEDPDTGEITAHGYGYEGMEAVKGVPYLWDFDPVFTKRMSSQATDYDADCSYVVMMLVLLASVRAQYGESVSRIMANRVIGRSVDGKPMDPNELPEDYEAFDLMAASRRARERATGFCTVLRSVLPVFAKGQEGTLGVAYDDVAKDFADIVRSEIIEHWDAERNQDQATWAARPVFSMLVRYLSRSSQADTSIFNRASPGAQAAAALDRERAQRVEQRLAAVLESRQERLWGGRP